MTRLRAETQYESVERLRKTLRENAGDAINLEHYPDAAKAYENALAMVEAELPSIISEVFRAGAKLALRSEVAR